MVESSLRVRTFIEAPSPDEFADQIEPKNVPAVFQGCVKHWEAISKWSPSNGGLDYLQGLVGSSPVEVMLSRSSIFYGDIRSHERVPLPFSTFIGFCKSVLQNSEGGQDNFFKSEERKSDGSDAKPTDVSSREAPEQYYLAQVPIMNSDNKERVQMECLRVDIEMPEMLRTRIMASVNFWMNSTRTRSSTHYDPHHNLLCIIAGCKQVSLWPPSASSFLYLLPLYGEASNHSGLALEDPNLEAYPRAKCLRECVQKVVLHAGDALFIPEGWFHQVDSDDLTIAVNFWWRSTLMSSMLEHMDGYYLRRILKRLIDKEMNKMLCRYSTPVDKALTCPSSPSFNECIDRCDQALGPNSEGNNLEGTEQKLKLMLHELDPHEIQSLHELISLVHNQVNQSQPIELVAESSSAEDVGDEVKKHTKADVVNLQDDPVANIICTLQPRTFHNVFLAMAHNFPRTLEALVLHALSPVGAEVLTSKFEEMDQLIPEEDRNQFYQILYGVFDDQFAAMDALLNRKESFACQAFKNVLDQYLGISFDGPKPSIK